MIHAQPHLYSPFRVSKILSGFKGIASGVFLTLLLSFGSVWAQCVWQGEWCVAPDGARSSHAEYTGPGARFRTWSIYPTSDKSGEIKKLYEFDCEAKTYKVLEFNAPYPKYSSWEEFQSIKNQILSENHYFIPGDTYDKFCKKFFLDLAEYKREQEAAQALKTKSAMDSTHKKEPPKKGTP